MSCDLSTSATAFASRLYTGACALKPLATTGPMVTQSRVRFDCSTTTLRSRIVNKLSMANHSQPRSTFDPDSASTPTLKRSQLRHPTPTSTSRHTRRDACHILHRTCRCTAGASAFVIASSTIRRTSTFVVALSTNTDAARLDSHCEHSYIVPLCTAATTARVAAPTPRPAEYV